MEKWQRQWLYFMYCSTNYMLSPYTKKLVRNVECEFYFQYWNIKYSFSPCTDLLNDRDDHGNTALHYAVQSDCGKKNMDKELSKKLIEHGAGMFHLTNYCDSSTFFGRAWKKPFLMDSKIQLKGRGTWKFFILFYWLFLNLGLSTVHVIFEDFIVQRVPAEKRG